MVEPAPASPVERARAQAPLNRDAADEAESQRRLPERVAVAMAEAGLYRVGEVGLRSARALVFEAVEAVWQKALAGRPTEPRERALVHLACSHAVRAAAEAVARVREAVGTRANFEGHPLERRLRDVRVVPQHLTVSSQWLETAGGVLLGLSRELPFG